MSEKETGIPRVEYRKLKNMNRVELSAYMERIWMRGYMKGKEDALGTNKPIEKAPEVEE